MQIAQYKCYPMVKFKESYSHESFATLLVCSVDGRTFASRAPLIEGNRLTRDTIVAKGVARLAR